MFNLESRLILSRSVNARPAIQGIQQALDRNKFRITVGLDTRQIKQVETLLNKSSRSADALNTSLSNVNATANRLGQTLNQNLSAGNFKHINSELATTSKRISAVDSSAKQGFGSIVTNSYLAYRAINALQGQFKSFIDFQSKMVKLGQVINIGVDKTKELGDEIRATAIKFGTSSSDIADLATELLRAGESTSKVREQLSLFAKLSLSESINDIHATGKGIIVLSRVFGQSSDEIEVSLGKIAKLSSLYAVETSDVIKGLEIAGPLWKNLGGTVSEFAAVFASTAESNQLSAETNAHALKTLSSRLVAPESITALATFGITLEDVNGKFVGPIEALKRLHDALGDIEDTNVEKIQLLTKLGGVRQLPILISLLNSYNRQQEAKNILDSTSTKLIQDATLAQASYAVQLKRVQETIQRDFAKLFDDRAVKDFTSNIFTLTEAFSKLLPVLAPLVPIIAAVSLKSLAGKLNVGSGISGIGSSIGSSFAAGYNRPIQARAVPSFARLPSPNVSGSTLQKPIYQRDVHFKPDIQGIGAVSDQFNKKSITQQISFVNKLSSNFADLSPTTKQLNGAFRHYLIQVNDGIASERALENTRAALMRVQAKQAAQLGIATNINTSYAGSPANKTAGFFGGAKNLLQSHGQGAAVLGLLANQANPHGVSRELINAGGGAGLAASFSGLGGPASIGVGLVAAFASYGSIVEDEAKRLSSHRLSKAADDLAASLKLSGGKFTSTVLADGNKLLESLRDKQARKSEAIPFIQGLSTYAGRVIPNALQGKYQDKNDINSEILAGRDTDFKESIKQNIDGLDALRQHILGSVKTLDEFKNFGGGLGDRLLQNLKKIDPAIEQATKQILEATNATSLQAAIAKNLANSISKATVEVDAQRRSIVPAYKLGTGVTGYESAELGTHDFSKQIGRLGLSKERQSELQDLNLVRLVAPKILSQGRGLGDKDSFAETIGRDLKKAGVSHATSYGIADSLAKKGFDEFLKSLDNIDDASNRLIEDYKPLISSVQQLTQANLEAVNVRNENYGKTASQYGASVDARLQAQLASLNVADTVARYRKGPLDTTSGNNLVLASAKALGGSSDPAKLGESLKKLNDEFEKTKDIRLKDSILHVESALKLLGDTATRTRNIEEELNKAKSQKDAKLGLVESFYSGDLKSRLAMVQGARLAGAATRAGSLNGFSIPDQAKIIASLKAVADIKLASGLTGKETLEALLKKSVPGIVAPEEATIKDLERKSIEVGISAAEASRQLAVNQETLFRTFLTGMGEENRAFLSSLGTLLAPSRIPHHAAGGFVSGPGTATSDSVNARLSNGEYVLRAAAVRRLGVGYLDSLNMAGGGSVARQYRRQQYLQSQFNKTDSYIRSRRPVYEYPNRQSQFQDYSNRFANFRNTTRLQRSYGNQNYGRGFASGGLVSNGGPNMAGVSASIDRFHSSVLNLSTAISRLDGFNIPSHIEMRGQHDVNVIFNGHTVLNELLNGPLTGLIRSEIERSFKAHLPLQMRLDPVT